MILLRAILYLFTIKLQILFLLFIKNNIFIILVNFLFYIFLIFQIRNIYFFVGFISIIQLFIFICTQQFSFILCFYIFNECFYLYATYQLYTEVLFILYVPINEICSICLDTINIQYYKLKCNHVFHTACLDEWIKSKNNCPLCRCILSIYK